MAIRNLTYTGSAPLATTATICTIPTGGGDAAQVLGMQVTNAGYLLDVFNIDVRCGPSAVWTTIASAAGDYSSPASPLLRVVGTPVSLADAATCLILMVVQGIHEVRIQASSGATAATVLTVNCTLG